MTRRGGWSTLGRRSFRPIASQTEGVLGGHPVELESGKQAGDSMGNPSAGLRQSLVLTDLGVGSPERHPAHLFHKTSIAKPAQVLPAEALVL
jgi:hypothetical protein